MTATRPRGDTSALVARTPVTGVLLTRRILGVDATYRVAGRNARGVEVEVVDVPGLRAGSRFTFLPEDATAMDVISR